MIFRYSEFALEKPSKILGESVLRPIIPLKLSFNDLTIKYEALIDSGADFSVFEAELGEYLGLDIKSGLSESFKGVQGKESSIVYFHKVVVTVLDIELKTKIGFSYDIAGHAYGILGQKGFLDYFNVKLSYSNQLIEILPAKIIE